ncbi:microsomal signal peptidase 25 kDa subunit-domain-containing protein [Spinellus fusiger]|nr:microsomal signal peptidase 25 kDa subunit-domain-containing protein [Spinellus fusiger]
MRLLFLHPLFLMSQQQPVHINKYDGTTAKITLDDQLIRFFGAEQRYKQVHTHEDVRLFLGYVSCAVAGIAFLNEYKSSFNEAKAFTLVCVVIFWLLQCVLWGYTTFVQKGVLFLGKDAKGVLTVKTTMKQYSPMYTVDLTYTAAHKTVQATVTKSISNWFDDQGVFADTLLDAFLAETLLSALTSLHAE